MCIRDRNKTIREGIDNMLYTLDPYTEYYPEEDQSELEPVSYTHLDVYKRQE